MNVDKFGPGYLARNPLTNQTSAAAQQSEFMPIEAASYDQLLQNVTPAWGWRGQMRGPSREQLLAYYKNRKIDFLHIHSSK